MTASSARGEALSNCAKCKPVTLRYRRSQRTNYNVLHAFLLAEYCPSA
jgi:hypothetical protein